MADTRESSLDELRRRAERALERSVKPAEVEPLLERLLDRAQKGSDTARFAHRHLAELRLETNPWRAALHLRELLQADDHDDVLHALMGLCQALLGNYRAAVSSYRRALSYAPHTPWYHHNVGHLLDVALSDPGRAESHLRSAYRMQPGHDEIAASLAHCLARLDQLDEARTLAEQAVAADPDNAEHGNLLAWILAGAPERPGTPTLPPTTRGRPRDADREPITRAVRHAFEARMSEAGFSAAEVDGARSLWADFHEGRHVRGQKPEVYAAAVEYAMALVQNRAGTTQVAIARRYGVSPASLSSRYSEIRAALELRPRDPRYAAGS